MGTQRVQTSSDGRVPNAAPEVHGCRLKPPRPELSYTLGLFRGRCRMLGRALFASLFLFPLAAHAEPIARRGRGVRPFVRKKARTRRMRRLAKLGFAFCFRRPLRWAAAPSVCGLFLLAPAAVR